MKKVLILGDSHVKSSFGKLNDLQSDINFKLYRVTGATAQGAVNPRSKTKALSIFKKRLSKINFDDYDYVAIMLGEIDCGFVIWYRAEKYSISIDEQLNLSVSNLFSFIEDEFLSKVSADKILVIGSVLPTIGDNVDLTTAPKYYIGHQRYGIKATQHERTELTKRYNSILKNKADKLGYKYIDITNETLNKKTNIIDTGFLNEHPYDHHLSSESTKNIWLNKIQELFND